MKIPLNSNDLARKRRAAALDFNSLNAQFIRIILPGGGEN